MPKIFQSDPRTVPPKGVMTDKEYMYFMNAAGVGKYIPGGMGSFEFCSPNSFGVSFARGKLPILSIVQWESHMDFSMTACMMHTGCFKVLRSILGLEDDNSAKELADFYQIGEILGQCLADDDHGRFKGTYFTPTPHIISLKPTIGATSIGVCYEAVGEKIDLRPYWFRGYQLGKAHDHVVFDYNQLIADGKQWLITRPDVFPRLHRIVDHAKRIAPFGGRESVPGTDILTSQPLPIMHLLVSHLSAVSFLLLEEFPWAFPTRLEFDMIKQNKAVLDAVASPDLETCGPECDWLGYLSTVHGPKSKSMRTRRYIWSVCMELKREYDGQLAGKEEGDSEGGWFYTYPEGRGPGAKAVPTSRRKELEKIAVQMSMMNQMGDGGMAGMKMM
ncbi:hypothetical protein PQX77_019997 [Marasmius sp. AFHP31]|nr:hypothetical protein PQX77_019997 [Marasmius sp. AFHP31]